MLISMERDNTQVISGLLSLWVEAPENSQLREDVWAKIQQLEKERIDAKLAKLRNELEQKRDNTQE